MTDFLRVATVQFQHRAGDKQANLATVGHWLARVAAQGAKIVCFPEMCVTGYWHVRHLTQAQIAALAEPVPAGPTTDQLSRWAKQYQVLVAAGLIEADSQGRLFNSYVCCLPDGAVYCHRKLHCFVSEHLASGDRFTVFDTPWGCRVGVLICWDNNLVENVRATALLGADILLAPHQTGGCCSRSPHAMQPIDVELWERRAEEPRALEQEFLGPNGRAWLQRWLPARAHDNGLFVLFSNGVGRDDDEVRTGNAMVLDCYGRILSETWAAADQAVIADLDLGLLPLCTGRRWLRGRRPELYDILSKQRGDELDPRNARFSSEPV